MRFWVILILYLSNFFLSSEVPLCFHCECYLVPLKILVFFLCNQEVWSMKLPWRRRLVDKRILKFVLFVMCCTYTLVMFQLHERSQFKGKTFSFRNHVYSSKNQFLMSYLQTGVWRPLWLQTESSRVLHYHK